MKQEKVMGNKIFVVSLLIIGLAGCASNSQVVDSEISNNIDKVQLHEQPVEGYSKITTLRIIGVGKHQKKASLLLAFKKEADRLYKDKEVIFSNFRLKKERHQSAKVGSFSSSVTREVCTEYSLHSNSEILHHKSNNGNFGQTRTECKQVRQNASQTIALVDVYSIK